MFYFIFPSKKSLVTILILDWPKSLFRYFHNIIPKPQEYYIVFISWFLLLNSNLCSKYITVLLAIHSLNPLLNKMLMSMNELWTARAVEQRTRLTSPSPTHTPDGETMCYLFNQVKVTVTISLLAFVNKLYIDNVCTYLCLCSISQ